MAQFSTSLKHLKSAAPIIIVGMHRSGTSMLTRMLEECGVFWGAKKDEYNESVFFQSINEQLFNVAKATWDNPAPVEEYLSSTQHFSTALDYAGIRLVEGFSAEYFNRCQSDGNSEMREIPLHWGWKDPRNVFTLAVWHKIFPQARIIHILRHGIDVAASLWRRETTRPEGSQHPHFSMLCQDQYGCYLLWSIYVKKARDMGQRFQGILEIRYEELIAQPGKVFPIIAKFIGLKLDPGIDHAIKIIKPHRRLAFRSNPQLDRLRNQVRNDSLIKELGYAP